MILALLFSLFVSAQTECKPIYGMKDDEGFWYESFNPELGYAEIVRTKNCQYDPDALELIDGKWVMRKKARDAKFDLDKKFEALEAKVKAIEESEKAKVK
jgi:hypothetical protein